MHIHSVFSVPHQSCWQASVRSVRLSSMNHSCCLAHSCLVHLVRGGKGRAKWRGHMAAPDVLLLYCRAHQKQQVLPPWSRRHLGGSRQQLLSLPKPSVWTALFSRYSPKLCSDQAHRRLLANAAYQTTNPNTLGPFGLGG